MRLLIIRHGDPDYEHDTLTEAGRLEVQLLAERMKNTEVDDYYVSTMGRAKDTIAPTLEATGRTAEAFDWLREFNLPTRRPELHGGYATKLGKKPKPPSICTTYLTKLSAFLA